MAWSVEYTNEFQDWFSECDEEVQDRIDAAVEVLEERGPGLGRPFVDHIKGSRHPNMKELRPRGSHVRILFVFDPLRNAILLIGGDKTNRWQSFYGEMIPIADRLYDEHLLELRREGRRGEDAPLE